MFFREGLISLWRTRIGEVHIGSALCMPTSKAADDSFARALKTYRYSAPALSLLERLGLDNFWGLLASRVYPAWLAPNLLTAAGGVCVGLAAALTLWHSPSLGGACPQWVYAVNALLLFAYQTLDGSDGKQARRTQSGSPIGELMDHGIDAWAVGAMVTTCLDAFGFGVGSAWPWLILLGAQAAFFASNLTLLHVGRMRVDDVGVRSPPAPLAPWPSRARAPRSRRVRVPRGLAQVIELQATMIGCLLLTAACTPAVWRVPVPWLGVERRVALGAATFAAMALAVAGGVGEALSAARAARPAEKPTAARAPADAAPAERAGACGSPAGQLALLVLYVGSVGVALRRLGVFAHAPPPAAAVGHLAPQLRLLLLAANSAFAELMARILVLRIGQRPLPRVATPATLALLAFVVTCGGGSTAGAPVVARVTPAACAACASCVVALHAAYFVWAVRAGCAALGLHTFRVRGARSWWRL